MSIILDAGTACWCLRQESNLRQPVLQTSALPTELQRHILFPKQQNLSAGFRSMEAGTARCPAVRRSGILPPEIGRSILIENDDLVNRHIKKMRKNHHIVDRGHCVAAHPFENRLRCIEAASDLHIGNPEPLVFDKRLDICAGRRHVYRRRIGRHKNTTFLTEYKKPSACLTFCTQTVLFYQKMVHNETRSHPVRAAEQTPVCPVRSTKALSSSC